jgi:hypothetical protein
MMQKLILPVLLAIMFPCDAFKHSFRRPSFSVQNFIAESNCHIQQHVEKPTALFAAEVNIRTDEEISDAKGMPDKTIFQTFFRNEIAPGSDMTLPQFMKYPEVAQSLSDQLIFPEDVNDLWISAVGDATGLNVEEAYEMLCMVVDLPDPEYLQYLDEEFSKLAGTQKSVNFVKFLRYSTNFVTECFRQCIFIYLCYYYHAQYD